MQTLLAKKRKYKF